jgi:hypothetical protein
MYSLYLAASNFFLLRLEDNTMNRAGLPQKLMDYMAVGRPVIAPPVQEIKKPIGDSELLVKPSYEK